MQSPGGAPVRRPRLQWTITAVFLLVAAVLTAGSQQNTTPTPAASSAAPAGPIMLVIVDVKPEMWDDYVAMQKAEAIPALQKGGVEERSAWRTAAFGPSYNVAYLYPLKSFSMLDGEPPIRRALGEQGESEFNAKMRRMVLASRSCALRERPELGFGTNTTAEPKLGVLAHVYTMPGKQSAFEGVLKSDWAPALRKGGVSLYAVHEVVMGGEVGEFYTFTPIDNLAALDAGHPIVRGLGAAAYGALLTKMAPLTRSVERTVIRRDDGLSFTMKKPTT